MPILKRKPKLVYGEDITTRMAKVKKLRAKADHDYREETSEKAPPKPNRAARRGQKLAIASFTRRMTRQGQRIARLKAIVDDSVTLPPGRNGAVRVVAGYQLLSGPSSHSRYRAP